MAKKILINEQNLLADVSAGILNVDLAKKYGVSAATITNRLKSLGVIKPKIYNNQEYIKRCSVGAKSDANKVAAELKKISHNTPEFKLRQSVRSKELWQDKSFRDVVSSSCKESCNTQEHLDFLSTQTKTLWKDDKFRLARAEDSRQMWASDSIRDRITKSNIEAYQDQALLDRHSATSKRWWSVPEHRIKAAVIREQMPRTLTKPHLKVCAILDSLNVKYECEKAIGPWNFDIFIQEHSLLIEVQGNYWHSLKPHQQTDAAKSTYIKEYFPQYQLKYIWEHECLTEGSVLAKIKYWLGIDKVNRADYDFSEVGIALPDAKEADAFLYNWHYQHHGRHGLDIGCYLNTELIAIARFTSPHRQEIATSVGYKHQQVLELARLCVHPKYQKKNLLSWFLARAEEVIRCERPDAKCLVSFADSTYNHTGAVYKASNWILNRIVEPNYWYVDDKGWVMHKKTLWNHSKKMCVSESEYASKYGYTKVWGKEKYKFTKVL